MNTRPFDIKAGIDRFSTSDEVRLALSFWHDVSMKQENDKRWEVASDLGGYVLIEPESDDVLTLLEELDAKTN